MTIPTAPGLCPAAQPESGGKLKLPGDTEAAGRATRSRASASDAVVAVTQPAIDATVDQLSAGLGRYLVEVGLPTEGVLTKQAERIRVLDTLPALTGRRSAERDGLLNKLEALTA